MDIVKMLLTVGMGGGGGGGRGPDMPRSQSCKPFEGFKESSGGLQAPDTVGMRGVGVGVGGHEWDGEGTRQA